MPSDAVLTWLLEADPAIRWQVKRDLLGASADDVAAERAQVARAGWGAQLLAAQADDGRWGGAAWNRGWNSTMHVLMLLRDFGLDPADDRTQDALERVATRVTWRGCGPAECDRNAFFAGELEPCINGQVAGVGAYFGRDVRPLIERLLAEQLPDGGWNCAAPTSTRSSFNTTICVLEALLAFELRGGGESRIAVARRRGEEYLLERRLFRRRSTGEEIVRDRKGGADWRQFAFPTWWHYDVLRALDYLHRAGIFPDERLAEAIALVARQRDEDGRWKLGTHYAGVAPIEFGEAPGQPSRWITLRALRVLHWAGQST